MRKFTAAALVVLVMSGLFTGCGDSYSTDTSTVFVLKDGKVVSTDVEAFDENTYDLEKLETFVKDSIDTYTGTNGGDSVVMKSLTVEDGNAKLILEYASASDYAGFNGTVLYTGSVADALVEGYAFNVDFGRIEDGKPVPCDVNDILGNSEYRVVICRENANVNVAGKIVYVSVPNTTYVDENTVAVREGASLFGQSAEDTQSEENTEDVSDTEDAGAPDGEDSSQMQDELLSDELIITPEEETDEVFFEFEEEPSGNEPEGREGHVYTYIIYK